MSRNYRDAIFHNLWVDKNLNAHVSVLLDDDRRFKPTGRIFVLATDRADLVFYHAGLLLAESEMIGIAIAYYERIYGKPNQDKLFAWYEIDREELK